MTETSWTSEAQRLLAVLMESPPEAFRASATRAISRTAEAHALARQSAHVELDDVVVACLRVTPEPFRAKMLTNLVWLGIDLSRYPEMLSSNGETAPPASERSAI